MTTITNKSFLIEGREISEEFLESEKPAIEQLHAMGYEYKSQSELNKERRDYREVLLYDRLEAAIMKHNPELDEDGIYEALDKLMNINFLQLLIQWIQMKKLEQNWLACQGQVD